MKSIRCLLLSILLLASSPLWAMSPVLLPDGSFDFAITQYVAVYEDKTARLGIERMLTREQQLRFTPSHSQTLKFGVSDSVFWLRLSITNPYNDARQGVISLSNSRLDQVRLFDITEDSLRQALAHQQPGKLRGGFQQAYPFRIELKPKATHSYLIRLSSDSVFNSGIRLSSLDHFLSNEQAQFWTLGLVLGWILATMAYFAHLGWQRRLPLAGWGMAYCLAMAGYLIAWSSLGAVLQPLPNLLREQLALTCLPLAAIAFNLAIYSLPWAKSRIRTGLLAMSSIQFAIAIIALFSDGFSDLLVTVAVTVNYLVLAVWLLFSHCQQRMAQRPLQWAASLAGIGLLISLLSDLNLLQLDVFTDWATLLLPMVMVVGLVLASMQLSRPRQRDVIVSAATPWLTPDLLNQVSHELRSPINGVMGMSELLADSPLSASQRECLDTINIAGQDLSHVTQQLSDLARIYNQQLELERKAFAVGDLMEQTLVFCQQQSQQKQIELLLDISSELPARYIGDQQRLTAILYALLNHTLGYAEFGELTLRAQPFQQDGQHGLHIQLLLNGNLSKHDEFRNVLRQLQPQRGSDQGLNGRHWDLLICRHLLIKMQAQMTVECINHQGACVDVYLPLTAEHQLQQQQTQRPELSLEGRRILVVDDNATLRTVLEKHLRRWNAQVWVSHSGPEALAQLRSQVSRGEAIDTVITDQDMPAMTGIQLAVRIENDGEITPKPKLMMLTGMVTASLKREALDTGIRHVVAKPVTADKLRRSLQELES